MNYEKKFLKKILNNFFFLEFILIFRYIKEYLNSLYYLF